MGCQQQKYFKNKNYNDVELDKIKQHKISVCVILTYLK